MNEYSQWLSANHPDAGIQFAFPIGPTAFHIESFQTPAGRFTGTHCVVSLPDGDQHFYFSDQHPGPPIRIEGPGVSRQQVERSDIRQQSGETA